MYDRDKQKINTIILTVEKMSAHTGEDFIIALQGSGGNCLRSFS